MSRQLTSGVLGRKKKVPIPVDGLVLWLDANQIKGLSDNDDIEIWEDASVFGNDAIQSTIGARPKYKTNVLNGLPVVRFDGNNYLNLGQPESLDFAPTVDEFSFFIVSYPNNGSILTKGSAQTLQQQYRIITGSDVLALRIGMQTPSLGSTNIVNKWSVKSIITSTSRVDAFINKNSDIVNGVIGDIKNNVDVLIGARREAGTSNTGTGYLLTGDIAEIIIYNRSITTEREDIENYLLQKYNL